MFSFFLIFYLRKALFYFCFHHRKVESFGIVKLKNRTMGFKVCFFVFLGCLLLVPETTMARDTKHASIIIEGASRITETDENFVCATLDWWPHDKCNYNNCPWGYSSVINMVITESKKRFHFFAVFRTSLFMMLETAIEKWFDLLNMLRRT